MSEAPLKSVSVLAILPDSTDQASLRGIFKHSKWQLHLVRTFDEAQGALKDPRIGVVICESCLAKGHCWRDVLGQTIGMPNPPPVIVTDRIADSSLWAEVLNLGGYDLLMKPFDQMEVYRVISLAWLSWKDQFDRTGSLRKGPGSAKEKRELPRRAQSGM